MYLGDALQAAGTARAKVLGRLRWEKERRREAGTVSRGWCWGTRSQQGPDSVSHHGEFGSERDGSHRRASSKETREVWYC